MYLGMSGEIMTKPRYNRFKAPTIYIRICVSLDLAVCVQKSHHYNCNDGFYFDC